MAWFPDKPASDKAKNPAGFTVEAIRFWCRYRLRMFMNASDTWDQKGNKPGTREFAEFEKDFDFQTLMLCTTLPLETFLRKHPFRVAFHLDCVSTPDTVDHHGFKRI